MCTLSLGIDTSNYTTSVALVDENETIICNQGILLEVKSGEKGLRQSDALFQHINNLPTLLKDLPRGREIEMICFSERPRPLPDSYMPVFNVGKSLAQSLAGVLGAELLAVSHQENHIRAAIYGSGSPKLENPFCGVHFSGGTSEILLVRKEDAGFSCEIMAQTLDLNAGQLIDRIALLMGCAFPGGRALEALAEKANIKDLGLDTIISTTMDGVNFHFSGQENQAQEYLKKGVNPSEVAFALLKSIGKTLSKCICKLHEKQRFQSVLFSGGVMSNKIIKMILLRELKDSGINLYFSPGLYARDNALGNALLGMDHFKKTGGDYHGKS